MLCPLKKVKLIRDTIIMIKNNKDAKKTICNDTVRLQAVGFLVRSRAETRMEIMVYKQPARQWMEATPLGNGRLGAMIFGGIKTEKLP